MEVEKHSFLVHASTNTNEITDSCQKIITSSDKQFLIELHGLETGQPLAISICNSLVSKYADKIKVKTYSSSVDLIDSLTIIAKELEKEGLKHTCSVLHIEITSRDN